MTISYAVGQRLTASLLQTLADYTVNRPIVRLIATATQNLTDNTGAAITFGAGSTVIDTHSFHSESVNTSRVTPTVAGYYKAWGTAAYAGQADNDPITLQTAVRFNGVDQVGNVRVGPNTTNTPRGVAAGPVILLCNGTTDYIELSALQDNTDNDTTATTSSGSTNSYLEVEFVRPS